MPTPVQQKSGTVCVPLSDVSSDLETGTGIFSFRIPYNMYLTEIPRISLGTAPTGSTFIVDININASSILSTKLSIDISELTSVTSSSQAVLTTNTISDNDIISFDIDQIGSSATGKNLVCYLIGVQ